MKMKMKRAADEGEVREVGGALQVRAEESTIEIIALQ